MDQLRERAIKLGLTDLKVSTRKGKKYMVKYNNKWVHFGARGYSDFTQHKDEIRRANYRARHSKIKLKDGRLAHKVKGTASWISWNLLW